MFPQVILVGCFVLMNFVQIDSILLNPCTQGTRGFLLGRGGRKYVASLLNRVRKTSGTQGINPDISAQSLKKFYVVRERICV